MRINKESFNGHLHSTHRLFQTSATCLREGLRSPPNMISLWIFTKDSKSSRSSLFSANIFREEWPWPFVPRWTAPEVVGFPAWAPHFYPFSMTLDSIFSTRATTLSCQILARSGNYLDSLMTIRAIAGIWLFAGPFAATCKSTGIRSRTGLPKSETAFSIPSAFILNAVSSTAMKTSLVSKYRYNVPLAIRARRATSSRLVPAYPFSANTPVAASMISNGLAFFRRRHWGRSISVIPINHLLPVFYNFGAIQWTLPPLLL